MLIVSPRHPCYTKPGRFDMGVDRRRRAVSVRINARPSFPDAFHGKTQTDLRRQGQGPVRRSRARHPGPVFQG
ncbi:hypothetical protein MTBSS4_430001 [Magnetospirillum sp. SS-4]|nr:hypothetical protein MTBSS4_430001 [Magnetospirillum sp. SS-4]